MELTQQRAHQLKALRELVKVSQQHFSIKSLPWLISTLEIGRGTGKTVTLNGTAVIQEVGSIN